MVIAVNIIFWIIAVFGAAMCVGFACWSLKDDANDVFDVVFGGAVGIIGLALCIFLGIVMYNGFTDKVEFTMKNKDGKVIEKTVHPIEYRHDGNCFVFANDPNYYCGWEINYQYK